MSDTLQDIRAELQLIKECMRVNEENRKLKQENERLRELVNSIMGIIQRLNKE